MIPMSFGEIFLTTLNHSQLLHFINKNGVLACFAGAIKPLAAIPFASAYREIPPTAKIQSHPLGKVLQ
jgi:hypothetical protein